MNAVCSLARKQYYEHTNAAKTSQCYACMSAAVAFHGIYILLDWSTIHQSEMENVLSIVSSSTLHLTWDVD